MRIVYPLGRPWLGSEAWPRRTAFLAPAAIAYRLGSLSLMRLRRKRERALSSSASIISVGNLEVGGGGKTPLCIYLLESLVRGGYHPVYVSRGYRSGSEKLDMTTVVLQEEPLQCPSPRAGLRFLTRRALGLHEAVGDEGAMVAARVPEAPLLFSRRKDRAVEAAIELFKPTHVILDDAFQSWGLRRDSDIVLLDARKPFGNGRLLPAGTLREGLEALRRADWIGFNDIEDPGELDDLRASLRRASIWADSDPPVPIFGIRRRLSFSLAAGSTAGPAGRPVASLSSIARPERFDRSLVQLGCDVRLSIRYPDHHDYAREDLTTVQSLIGENGLTELVTTEKDWVKLGDMPLPAGTAYIARLETEIVGQNPIGQMMKPQATPAASL